MHCVVTREKGDGMNVVVKARSSAALRSASSFYSASGRTSILRMVAVAVAAASVLWVCSGTRWTYGLLVNGIAGAAAGAAVAKLVVEAVRRLRDAGINLRLAALGALALGAVMIGAVVIAVGSDAGQGVIPEVAIYGPLAVAAVALLWPPRRRPVPLYEQPKASFLGGHGPRFAIACIACATGIALFNAWLEHGMDEANQRAMRFSAEHGYDRMQP